MEVQPNSPSGFPERRALGYTISSSNNGNSDSSHQSDIIFCMISVILLVGLGFGWSYVERRRLLCFKLPKAAPKRKENIVIFDIEDRNDKYLENSAQNSKSFTLRAKSSFSVRELLQKNLQRQILARQIDFNSQHDNSELLSNQQHK